MAFFTFTTVSVYSGLPLSSELRLSLVRGREEISFIAWGRPPHILVSIIDSPSPGRHNAVSLSCHGAERRKPMPGNACVSVWDLKWPILIPPVHLFSQRVTGVTSEKPRSPEQASQPGSVTGNREI